MSLVFGVAIYIVIWWVVLFAILPLRVKTQEEDGEVTDGTPESAPVLPLLGWKFATTTVVAAILFGGVYVLLVYKPIGLNEIPFLPQFGPAATGQ